MHSSRTCVRPGCGAPGEATLTYHYASRTAWLDHLAHEAEPSSYELCGLHADRFTVPLGWNREDRRAGRTPTAAPIPADSPDEDEGPGERDELFGIQLAG
jgi:hypothetical protein